MINDAYDAFEQISTFYRHNYKHQEFNIIDNDLLGYSPDIHNQLRMAFSHTLRCFQTDDTSLISKEKQSAINHIQRATLDAYKTLYYSKLKSLETMFEQCNKAPIERIWVSNDDLLIDYIANKTSSFKKHYLDAKVNETKGNHSVVMNSYEASLLSQNELIDKLEEVWPKIKSEKDNNDKELKIAKKVYKSNVSNSLKNIAASIVTVALFFLGIAPTELYIYLVNVLKGLFIF